MKKSVLLFGMVAILMMSFVSASWYDFLVPQSSIGDSGTRQEYVLGFSLSEMCKEQVKVGSIDGKTTFETQDDCRNANFTEYCYNGQEQKCVFGRTTLNTGKTLNSICADSEKSCKEQSCKAEWITKPQFCNETIIEKINPFDDDVELKEEKHIDTNMPVPKVVGLENAIVRVKWNESRSHLTNVMNKIQEKDKEHLAKLSNVTFETEGNETVAYGKGKGKFLGLFKADKEYKYKVSVNGTITRTKSIKDFFVRDEVQ